MNKTHLPQGWKLVTLGEISKNFISGGTPSTLDSSFWEGNIPWVRSAWLRGKYVEKGERTITPEGLYNSSSNIIPRNNLLIATRVSLGNIAINKVDVAINQDLTGIILDKSKTSEEFVYFSFINDPTKITSHAQGSTIQGITRRQLETVLILLPPINEQKKITSILSNVDYLIQKTQKIIEQTQRFNKGLTWVLFTKGIGHTKFKKIKFLFGKMEEFPENWNVLRFDEFISFKSGSTPSRTNPEYFKGKIPWVTSTDLNRGIITNTLEKITEEAVKNTRLKIFPKGTFLIALYGLEAAGTRGKCGILGLDAAINQACMVLNPTEKVDSKYLFYYYLNFGEKIVFNVAQGTKQQNLSEDVLKIIKMPIPPISEQKMIIQILVNADSKIQFQKQIKSNLENLKKGLMQKLLTGQIRVKV